MCCSAFHGVVFFFQAEDGIRDLVRSRGLGDVYKRQFVRLDLADMAAVDEDQLRHPAHQFNVARRQDGIAVSYTHLTLPTSDLV